MAVSQETLRTFVAAQRLHSPSSGPHAAYMAPWQDRLPNGRLGPEYLPLSPVSGAPVRMDQAMAEHAEGRYPFSPGLWDHDEDRRMRAPDTTTPKESRIIQRYDSERVRLFFETRGHLLPESEVRVYVAFWVEHRSYPNCARHLGVAVSTVRDLVKKIRTRIRR